MNNIILSVCIATYNRASFLETLIKDLIKVESNQFEIVIVDNASTDNTIEVYQSFDDNRIKLYINNENIGGANNFVKSLEYGSGDYILYCNDRDKLDVHKLNRLIEYLKNMNASFIRTSCFHNQNKDKIISYKKGRDSLTNIGFAHHPTGLIFNNALLKKHINLQKYYDYDGVYIWDFIAYELSFYGDYVYIDNGLWKQATDVEKKTSKSNYITPWFDPVSRNKEMIFTIKFIDNLIQKNSYQINIEDFYIALLKYYIYASTYMYNCILTDEVEIAHYGLSGKGLSNSEFFSIASDVYMSYCLEEVISSSNFNWCKRIYFTSLIKSFLLMKILTPKRKKILLRILRKI